MTHAETVTAGYMVLSWALGILTGALLSHLWREDT